MSLPVDLNREVAAAIPSHASHPKIYVACLDVAVQCEEIRGGEFHEAEVLYDDDVYLKVFYNGNCENDYLPPGQYGNMYYWLGMHRRTSFLIGDDDNDEDDVAASSWEKAPQFIVWRKCTNAEQIDYIAVNNNTISGIDVRDNAVQVDESDFNTSTPAQVDAFFTDNDLFTEIIDNAFFTNDIDDAIFNDDVIEWDN